MIRLLLIALFALILGTWLVPIIKKDPGFIVIGYQSTTIETSLVLFIVALAVVFGLLYFTIRLLFTTFHFPADVRRWRQQRQIRHTHSLGTAGLIALAEGRWQVAENQLARAADQIRSLRRSLGHSQVQDDSLIYLLGAARAAHELDKPTARDAYLQQAHAAQSRKQLAAGMTDAELRIDAEQLDRALITLHELRSRAPKNALILRLLMEIEQRLEDWPALSRLLPELRKRKVADAATLDRLSLATYQGQLRAADTSLAALQLSWNNLPKAWRARPRMIETYVELLDRYEQDKLAADLIGELLKREWDIRLIERYASLNIGNNAEQLEIAESWLNRETGDPLAPNAQQHPGLLLTLGKLARRARLWGKARNYLEAAIGNGADAAAYAELGDLLLQLNEAEAATRHFRDGLAIALEMELSNAPQALAITSVRNADTPGIAETKVSSLGIPQAATD